MQIDIINEQDDLPINEDTIRSVVQSVISLENQRCDEVCVQFITDKEMCRLHEEFFDDPSPTDCISFPMDEEGDDFYRYLGEIFVCPETAKKYVAENGGNAQEETILYVVHGLLHCMGYDDIEDEDRAEMRLAEKKHMDHLKKQNIVI